MATRHVEVVQERGGWGAVIRQMGKKRYTEEILVTWTEHSISLSPPERPSPDRSRGLLRHQCSGDLLPQTLSSGLPGYQQSHKKQTLREATHQALNVTVKSGALSPRVCTCQRTCWPPRGH